MACKQFSCDDVVSLIQKLCENLGAVGLRHDRASVTWIGAFLQLRVKELEDKVAERGRATCGWGCPARPGWRDRPGQLPSPTVSPRALAVRSRRQESSRVRKEGLKVRQWPVA